MWIIIILIFIIISNFSFIILGIFKWTIIFAVWLFIDHDKCVQLELFWNSLFTGRNDSCLYSLLLGLVLEISGADFGTLLIEGEWEIQVDHVAATAFADTSRPHLRCHSCTRLRSDSLIFVWTNQGLTLRDLFRLWSRCDEVTAWVQT